MSRRNQSQSDHNYVARPAERRSSSDDDSSEELPLPRRRSRRIQGRRSRRMGENTDHDYVAIRTVSEREGQPQIEEHDPPNEQNSFRELLERRMMDLLFDADLLPGDESSDDDDIDEVIEDDLEEENEEEMEEENEEENDEEIEEENDVGIEEENVEDNDEDEVDSVTDNEIIVISDEAREIENQPNSDPADVGPTTSGNAEGAVARPEGRDAVVGSSDSGSPSPPKKRKRLSDDKAISSTPCVKDSKRGGGNVDEDDDDGLTCPICLEHWEMTGEHRLVSLRCGHLFGLACIRRWLLESVRQTGYRVCPQCKSRAANRDLRFLYAKRLRAVDRSEEHRLREELAEERRHSQSLKTEISALKMTNKMITDRLQSVEAENGRMKKMLGNGGSGGFRYDTNVSDPKQPLPLQQHRLSFECTVEVSREPGCRVLMHAERRSSLIVSQKSAQGLFPGFGVRFIDTSTFRTLSFLHTSAKLVRDICLNTEQQLLTVASMEPRAKMFDLRTRQVSTIFDSGQKPLWACAMDRKERENSLYLGGSNGSTYVYDVRFPESIVEEYKFEGDLSTVINIAVVNAGETFPFGGFIVCKLQSVCFYEYTCSGNSATGTRLNVEGPFSSMNYDSTYETLVISARATERNPLSRYIFGKLEKVDGTPVLNVKVTFDGSKVSPVMTRCTQLQVEGNTLVAGYLQDVKQLGLFDVRRERRVQSLPVNEVVYDVCPVYLGSENTYLAALTETKCRLQKMITVG